MGYALGGARILNHIIETGEDGLDAAIQQLREPNRQHKLETDETVAASIEKGKAASGKSHSVAVKEFGLACGKHKHFLLYLVCKHSKFPLQEQSTTTWFILGLLFIADHNSTFIFQITTTAPKLWASNSTSMSYECMEYYCSLTMNN